MTTKLGITPLLATLMVVLGGLGSGLISYLANVAGGAALLHRLVLPDPIGWAVGLPTVDLRLVAMIVGLAVLAALTWLFTWLVVRSAAPGRFSAVFFGTWGGIVVAALVSGFMRTPISFSVYFPPTASQHTDVLVQQFMAFATSGATWAMYWGWLTALAVALVFRSTTRPTRTQPSNPSEDGSHHNPGTRDDTAY